MTEKNLNNAKVFRFTKRGERIEGELTDCIVDKYGKLNYLIRPRKSDDSIAIRDTSLLNKAMKHCQIGDYVRLEYVGKKTYGDKTINIIEVWVNLNHRAYLGGTQ